MSGSCTHKTTLAAAIAALLVASASSQAAPDVDELLSRVGKRIEEYYKRAQTLICVEKVTAQPLDTDRSLAGFARVLEYDLRVELASVDNPDASDANFMRQLRKVNGRTPRPRDLDDRNTCLDPNPLSPEPLTFLLPAHRDDYAFTWVGFGKGKDANIIRVDFRPRTAEKPAYVEDPKGREGCFQLSVPGGDTGRVFVDATTYDVVRIEQHLPARVDIRVPFKAQRRRDLPDHIVVERLDLMIHYKPFTFDDPHETLLLPSSIEQVVLMHGAQSNRTTQTFSNYKRFMTGGRVVKQ